MSTKTIRTVSDLMKLMNEMANRNQQAIGRVNAKQSENVVSYNYVVTYTSDTTGQNPQFQVEQQPQNTAIQSVCNQWRNTEHKLSNVPDIFNDKIDFNCPTYSDISRLNDVMLKVVHKYELFGETEKAFEEVKKFYENFKQLEKLLTDLEEKLDKKEESQLPQLTERFDNINNELNDIKATFNQKVRFQFKCPPQQINYHRQTNA